MARCGCTPKCTCVFKDGSCTEIKITATPGGCGEPAVFVYAVDITTDDQTVFCGANGLNAILTHVDTNTVQLLGTGTAGSPLEAHVIRTADGNVPDPDALGTGNLIKELPGAGGGVYVSCEDVQDCVGAAIDAVTSDCLEYDDATNTISIAICGEPNGIECLAAADPGCPAGGLAVFPSSDANNSLTFGADNRLFAAAAAIIPGECMTFTGAGTQADPFVMTPTIAPELNGLECVPGQGLLVTPSSDVGNQLTFGGDTRLFANRCPLVLGGSQVLVGNAGPCFELVGGADCVTPMVATLRISDDVCQGLECRADGLFAFNDPTTLPPTQTVVTNIGPHGPFNGNLPITTRVAGPTCVTMVNPSPCRNLNISTNMFGTAEIGRNGGGFGILWRISNTGPGGPYATVSQFDSNPPTPANRKSLTGTFEGQDQIVGPGGSFTFCWEVTIRAVNAVNGRIFDGEYTVEILGRWET